MHALPLLAAFLFLVPVASKGLVSVPASPATIGGSATLTCYNPELYTCTQYSVDWTCKITFWRNNETITESVKYQITHQVIDTSKGDGHGLEELCGFAQYPFALVRSEQEFESWSYINDYYYGRENCVNATLTINSVESSDLGEYECRVSWGTKYGFNTVRTANVTVYDDAVGYTGDNFLFYENVLTRKVIGVNDFVANCKFIGEKQGKVDLKKHLTSV